MNSVATPAIYIPVHVALDSVWYAYVDERKQSTILQTRLAVNVNYIQRVSVGMDLVNSRATHDG